MDILLDSRGLVVRRHRQRFLVEGNGERREWAADDVTQIILGSQ